MMLAILVALAVSLTVTSDAQAPQQAPPRDARSDEPAAAVIRGRVTDADSGRPLRRAQIRVSAPELSQARTTSTNIQGRYEIKDLPAGRYTITVSRGGHLPLQYGQRRPGEPPKPLQLGEGQALKDVDFALPRAGVISGRITDETGDPYSGVTVWALQSQFFRGQRRLVPAGPSARTDDTGQYRILAVPPGDYLVMASIRETWMTDGEAPQVFSYAPTYFAGTGSPGDGQRVKVGVGQEVGGIDFGLLPIRAASLSGTAVGADGVPLAGATVSLNHEMAGPTFMTVGFAGTAKAAADGTWRMNDVAPGDYALEIRNTGREQGTETAYQPITVAGTDIENITLVAGAGGTAAGLVVTDSGAPLPEARLRVSATSTVPGSRMRPPFQEDNGLVGADGAFTLKGLIGPSLLRVGPLPRGWAIKEIEYGGRDHAETPLEVRSGQATSGVRIVLTKGFPAVTGHITDARGNPAEGTVLLFPADAARWLEAAGASRVARPDQAGLFRFDTVRPGDYLAVALEYVQQWQVFDPEFLEELRDDATKVAVAEGADRQVDLRLKR